MPSRAFVTTTQNSAALIAQALAGAARLCRRGDAYRRAGVLLPDLVPVGRAPLDLFAAPDAEDRATRRMAALDAINRRFGRATLRYGGELIGTGWHRRAGRVSPISTTRWGALPRVRAC